MYKNDFPILSHKKNWKNLIYFDSACSYLKNYKTIEWITYYYENYSWCSWDRESSFLWSLLQNEIDETRKIVQRFIWARFNDTIIFTSGTTDSINKLVYSLDENIIQTIITSDLEHNSNYLPQFEYSKQKKIDFHIWSYTDILDLDILEAKLSKIKKKFLFCFTQSSNIIWWTFNIKAISNLVHKYWWYIFVDDAQFIWYNEENVSDNNIDFLAFSSHKIWWPTGMWILYVKNGSENILKYSNQVWWGTVLSINEWIPKYKKIPYVLEWWVQNFSWILWLKSCIEYINHIWYTTINTQVLWLTTYFLDQLKNHSLYDLFSVISVENSSLITLIPVKFQSVDFHQYCNYFLEDYIISFRTGSMCADNYINNYLQSEKNIMRLSFWIYNTESEIDTFITVIKNYLKTM